MTKRAYVDDCNRGIADFFRWDESAEMLLASNPCPVLVARLLRLSRRVRNLVWRFLSGHADAEGLDWVNQFARNMADLLDRDGLPRVISDQVYAMHPIFVSPKVPVVVPLLLCRIVLAFTPDGACNAGIMCMTTRTPDKSQPHKRHYLWNAHQMFESDRYFDWYIVARAISIRFDKLILTSDIELQTMAREDDRWSLEPSLFIT